MSKIMPDTEVEKTLREIRERVRAQQLPARGDAGVTPTPRAENDDDTPTIARQHQSDRPHQSLAQLEANLSTTARAWDRLPPVVSNRAGLAARLELWIKRVLKRATNWYTWEQLNFNAAAHHALRDALAALRAHEQRLETYEENLAAAREEISTAMREEVGALARAGDEAAAKLASSLASFESRLASQESDFASLDSRLATHESTLSSSESRQSSLEARLASEVEGLRHELRERVAHVIEEQRVSYRQLSLEASEAAVALDRARRAVETRLEEIEKAVPSDK